MTWLDYSLIERLGLTLLHFFWQGALIGLLYWLTLIIARPASAQTRYNLAVATLLALGLAPVLTFGHLGSVTAEATAAPGAESAVLIQLVVNATAEGSTSTLLAWTVAAWLGGVLLLSARLILGWHYIVQLRRSARCQALAHLAPILDGLRSSMAIRKPVMLAVSDRIRSPVVVGWLKPLILFPPALVARLDADQIEMILAHELAHIRRHDHLINLFQTVIETLLFYHPVVALVSRRIRIERENACDDLAVRSTRKRLAYVEMLATLERLRQPGPRLVLGVQDGQILDRIRRLVERSRPRRQLGITLPALLGLMLAAGSAGVWLMPQPDTDLAPIELAETRAIAPAPMPIESTALPTTPLFALPRAESLGPASSASTAASVPEPAPETGPEALASSTPGSSEAISAAASTPAIAPPPLIESSAARPDAPAIDSTRTAEASNVIRPGLTTMNSGSDAPAALEIALRPNPAPAIEETRPEAGVSIEPPELTGGQLIQRVEPDFPRSARRRGVNGMVELAFTIDQRGQVQSIDVVQEKPIGWRFGEAARAAIEQWRFEPFRRGDNTVERQVRMEVEFDLAEVCEISTGSRLPRC